MEIIEEMSSVFGEKLEKLMKDNGVTANKLSLQIGIDRASISKYLKGESSPRINTFLSICKIFNVQPNYFLNADYSDYSVDNSKTEERKIIESLYCLCKHGFISYIDSNHYEKMYFDYALNIREHTLLSKILLECLRYADSELADNAEMCKKIADKYEPSLVEEIKK